MDDGSYLLRSAVEHDHPSIRRLIYSVRINPMGLDWRRFVVAVAQDGGLIGCGQVKEHGDGSRELASIAVVQEWRGRGVARAIIERLIDTNQGDLYLTCRAHLRPFYEKFGFQVVHDEADMAPYFRKIHRLARLFGRSGLIPTDLLVMQRDGVPAPS